MGPKAGAQKQKGVAASSASTPLALYKRGLAASKIWTPLSSARCDAEALSALATCCRQLQAKMGLTAETAVDGRSSKPAVVAPANGDTSGGGAGSGDAAVGGGIDSAAAAAAATEVETAACDDPLATVWPALEAVEAAMEGYGPVVRHSVDLDIEDWQDEPGFLLASCHLEIGRLLGRMWPRREAGELRHLRATRALFPNFVAGAVALAQALLSRADSPGDLQQAEQLLTRALAVAERLGRGQAEDGGGANGGGGGYGDGLNGANEEGDDEADGSLLLAASAACRREWEAGGAARRPLAMLLCQGGRDDEAQPHLEALGFTHRLARPVLHYPLDSPVCSSGPTSSSTASPGVCPDAASSGFQRYCRAVDSALPAALLKVLRTALAPDSRFWQEHGYGRVGYFSYMHELGSPSLSAVHDAATLLHRLVVARFPAAAASRYAEWWAHCRRHPSGHQLHFDSDDEGAGGVRNPLVSTVIYLTGGVGGPTLVTPQLLGGPLASHGWLIHPRDNRVGMFDSTVLHGVVPGRGPSPKPGEHRITLMIAFWQDIQCRPRADGLTGPSQPFPGSCSVLAASSGPLATASASAGSGRYTWMSYLPPHPEGPDGWGSADPRDAVPTAIDRVWERLDGRPAQQGAVQYDACFQGF